MSLPFFAIRRILPYLHDQIDLFIVTELWEL